MQSAIGSDARSGGRHGKLDIFVSDADRERAFRRARRHTRVVYALRIALPLVAMACLGVYGGALYLSTSVATKGVSVGAVTIDPTNLTMQRPSYDGFAKDGAQYKVRAKSAVADLRNEAPIRLDTIDGEIIQTTGARTRLKAVWGTYDQKKELLELYERIDIDGDAGLTARLTRATVFARESRIVSSEPVWAETTSGTISARNMTLDTKARRAAFRESVDVVLKPAPKPAPATDASPPKPARAAEPFGLDANSGEPVHVTARALDVDDLAKTALFRENVVARQGQATLEAPELDVIYQGRAALPGTAAPQPAEAAAEQGRLKSIKARGGVVMTSKTDRAESQSLDYDAEAQRIALAGNVVLTQVPERRVTADNVLLDQKLDTALLTGDVVVTQGRNVVKGGQLAIDRKAGTARLVTPAVQGRPTGRISTLFYQAEASGKRQGARKGDDDAAGESSVFGALGAGFKSDPDAPVEVEAAVLDVNDRRHTAVYTGAVVARQGAFIVRSEELTAHYTGEAGLVAAAQPAAPVAKTKSGMPGGTELKRIEARRNVIVTGTDGQQATGEWATFDVKANRIVMGGNVTVSQGKQVVRGNEGKRLVIDLTTGLSRFEAEPGAARPGNGSQVSGAFATSVAPDATSGKSGTGTCPPGAVCKSGRLEAIFYPGQVSEKARAKPGAAQAAPPGEKGDGKRIVKRPSGSSSSSWDATTSAPAKQ